MPVPSVHFNISFVEYVMMLSTGSDRKLFSEKYDSVAVVIVNWNSGAHLAKCLDKFCEHTLAPTKTIVVDNASYNSSERVVR